MESPQVETPDDILVTAMAREIQRGMLAEMREDLAEAKRHLLAAAHLELVLAEDYAAAGEESLAIRSRISAGSCFWRGGDNQRGRQVLEEIVRDHPEREKTVQSVIDDLLNPDTGTLQ
jgi:hypothetical protein